MIASRWHLVLAILTHDSYLLLFDVPKGSAAYKKQLNARTTEVHMCILCLRSCSVWYLAVVLGTARRERGAQQGWQSQRRGRRSGNSSV